MPLGFPLWKVFPQQLTKAFTRKIKEILQKAILPSLATHSLTLDPLDADKLEPRTKRTTPRK